MGLVSGIQRFSTADGEGLRTSVFLKGCKLSCAWCHNPESIAFNNEILYSKDDCIFCRKCEEVCGSKSHVFDGEEHIYVKETCKNCLACADVCPSNAITLVAGEMSAEEVLDQVMKDRVFYGELGGMTLSGGEPMHQEEFALEILELAKAKGLNTHLETSGYFSSACIDRLVRLTDVFLYDLKDGNRERHIRYTSVDHNLILSNLKEIDRLGGKTILRCLMVKGVNMEKEHLDFIVRTYKELNNVLYVDLLSYTPYGGSKNERLGYFDNGRKDWMPSSDEVSEVKKYLSEQALIVK